MIRAWRRRLRDVALLRRAAIPVMAMLRPADTLADWVAFPMYHRFHARDRANFHAQLRIMRSQADFVTLDAAVALLSQPRLSGRHICITFDDGWRGPLEHAWPILAEQSIPAAFFVVPGWIDQGGTEDGQPVIGWDECRQLARNGATIGSHTMTHARLARLDASAARAQLTTSRQRIEAELGRPCRHLACPWGQPVEDYLPDRDPAAARHAGYHSFLTTVRGRARTGASVWATPRIRLEPDWSPAELRYAFSF